MPQDVATIKCACAKCQCRVDPGKGFVHQGKTYCSRTCAYDCTQTTCVCVHDRCDADDAEPTGH